MAISSLLRMGLISAVSTFGLGAACAFAGTPDVSGNNAEVYSITIAPDSLPTGTYPEITGFVRNTSSVKNGKEGKAVFDVTATITLPSGSRKSLLWHDVVFSASQRKSYPYGRNYDTRQPGTYKVVYSVYDSGRKHLFSALAKSFVVSGPTATAKPPLSGAAAKAAEAAVGGQPKKEQAPETAGKPEQQARQAAAAQPQQPPPSERPAVPETGGERVFLGIGGRVNTLNFSGGPDLILWPLENFAIEGTYGFGTFTSYEARAFYRLPVGYSLRPYLGAGYLHAERKANVIGVDTKITGDSFTAFTGVELSVLRNVRVYADVSGTPVKLKKDVTTATQQATAVVKYTALTINVGFIVYLF